MKRLHGPTALILALAALAAVLRGALAAPAPAQQESALPCDCTDVDPRVEFTQPAEFSCWQQFQFGSCEQEFMSQTILEIPEGYCQITCGRCDCCPTLLNATVSAGLSEFAWALGAVAAAAAAGPSPPSNDTATLAAAGQPGAMATLLAPRDDSMRELFGRLGGKERITSDAAAAARLAEILSLHWLPPLNDTRAVWTSPFMRPGARMPTLRADGAAVEVVAPAGGAPAGEIVLRAVAGGSDAAAADGSVIAGNTARVVEGQRDLYACKGFVQAIDSVLELP